MMPDHPLPIHELKEITRQRCFVKLNENDQSLFISDAPRRMKQADLLRLQEEIHEHDFMSEVNAAGLMLIDLQQCRWKALLDSFKNNEMPALPMDKEAQQIYTLVRLLRKHPFPVENQPLAPIRTVLKRYGKRQEILTRIPEIHQSCALWLRQKKPLPSALADILVVLMTVDKVGWQ